MRIQHHGRSAAAAVAATIVLATVGCGGKGDVRLVGVRESVAHQGNSLTHGTVVFTPRDATPGPQAVGPIQSDGSFRMQTAGRHGVAAGGKFLVTVHCRRDPTPEEDAGHAIALE